MREALLHDLDAQKHWGQKVLGYVTLPGEQIALRFAEGSSEPFDLLVVASGAHSALWPEPPTRCAVAACVYGRLRLDASALLQLPPGFLDATRVIVDPAAVAILDAMRFAAGTAQPDYLYWALLLPTQPDSDSVLDAKALHRLVMQHNQHWTAALKAVFADTARDAHGAPAHEA